MVFSHIFNMQLTEWEERVLSAAHLSGVEIRPGMFSDEIFARLGPPARMLRELPYSWSRELSIEVLWGGSR